MPGRFQDRRASEVFPSAIGFLVPFILVLYLGLESGGYDVVPRGQAGILVWWFLLVFTLAGLLPAAQLPIRSWVGIGLLLTFGAWTFIGLAWTDSAERTLIEVSRVVSLLGILVLSIFIQGKGGLERTVAAVVAAIAVICFVALASKLQFNVSPEILGTGFLEDAYRLGFPLGYWNALGAFGAIGLPLFVWGGANARSSLIRAACGVALVATSLTVFFTFSRAGAGAAVVSLLVLVLLSPRRIGLFLRNLFPLLGVILLLAIANSLGSLGEGRPGPGYQDQADELTIYLVAIALVVAIAQVGIAFGEKKGLKLDLNPPRWLTIGFLSVGAVVLIVVVVSSSITGKVAGYLDQFRSTNADLQGSERVFSPSGNGRFELWSSVVNAWESAPVTGIGAGTFEYWWAQEGQIPLVVRDAHSLYLEVLAEQGLVGLLLILGLFGLVFVTGGSISLRSGNSNRRRGLVAATTAGFSAFMVAAGIDWNWEMTVVPASALLLAGAILGLDARQPSSNEMDPKSEVDWNIPKRLGVALAACLAIAVLAIDTVGKGLLESSRADFRVGKTETALKAAQEAGKVQPWAASPDLQQAYLLTALGRPRQAVGKAIQATDKESRSWRTWLVLAQVAARADKPRLAVKALRRTRELNPNSSLWQQN